MIDTHRSKYFRIGALVVLAHIVLLGFSLPISQTLSTRPLFHIDSAFHWYQMETARAFGALGSLVGYDPFFAAGYLGGVSYNASAKLPALIAVLLGDGLTSVVIYKGYVLAASIVAPALLVLAAWQLHIGRAAAAWMGAFGLLIWWISALRWYHTSGMVAYVLTSYAAIPYAIACWRAGQSESRFARIALLGVLGAVGLFIHPLFPLPAIAVFVGLTVSSWSLMRWRTLVVMAVTVSTLAVLANLYWILPSVQYSGWADNAQTPYQKHVDAGILLNEFIGRISGNARGAPVNPLLWLLSAYAIFASRGTTVCRLALGFMVAGLALMLYSAFGAAVPVLASTTPNRMSSAGYLLLCVPAGIGAAALGGALRSVFVPHRLVATAVALVLAVAMPYLIHELVRELQPTSSSRHGVAPPEIKDVGSKSRWVLEMLDLHTDQSARVLFETSGGRIHDGAHMAGYLALTSKREFIGGPYVYMHHAGFWDGWLFGKKIEEFGEVDFREKARLYNIGWALVHSSASRKWFDSFPGATRIATQPPLVLYKLDTASGYFAQGSGQVVARSFGELRLSRLMGEQIVLRYHYVPGLRTEPRTSIEAVDLESDRQPFILLRNPPPSLVITWKPN